MKSILDINSDRLKKKEIANIRSKLHKLVGADLGETAFINLITNWTRACIEYKNAVNAKFDDELNRQEAIISDLKVGIRGHNKILSKNYTSEDPALLKQDIQKIENRIKNCKVRISFIKVGKKIKYNPKTIKFDAIMDVFSVGEKLGLKNDGKKNAGRTHENKLIKFVKIITGLKGRNTVLQYYKKYDALK